MPPITHWFVESFRDKNGILASSKYVYGCGYRDKYLLHDPGSLPLYGHLARKALMHYAREHYNPHTICITMEPKLRRIIKDLVEYKVMNRTKGYDWQWIDNYFKKTVGDYYKLDLPYDQAMIDQGFAQEFQAMIEMDYQRPN